MSIFYHVQTTNKKEEGAPSAIYCTTNKEKAKMINPIVTVIEISKKILKEIPSINAYNQMMIQSMGHSTLVTYLKNQGYAGFILNQDTVIIYDLTKARILHDHIQIT